MGVRFVWKIINFSCLEDEKIRSRDFGNHQMIIDLFADLEYISFAIIRGPMRYPYNNISFALLDSEGSLLFWREKENVARHKTSAFYIKKHTIFGSMKEKFLPNGTLRVQCIMWDTQEHLLAPNSSFFYCSGDELLSEKIEKTFRWNIANISSLETGKQVELFTSEGKAQLSTSCEDMLTIRLFLDTSLRVKLSTPYDEAQVNCVISMVDVKGIIIRFTDAEYVFGNKYEVWRFDTPVTKSMLMCYQNKLLPNGTLSLSFACTITAIKAHDDFVSENKIFVKNSHPENKPRNLANNTISQALVNILEEGFMSDFEFRVQDKTFPVHKNILGARSSVFRAMFTADMKEKENGVADIPDVEADTFHRMLQFVYSDSVHEDMQWEGASKLYSVADKYALEPLKQKCSGLLKSRMSVSSVLDILLLGDAHQDDDLKASALDFIARNDKHIVASERWKRFAAENVLLAIEAFQTLYEKKVQVRPFAVLIPRSRSRAIPCQLTHLTSLYSWIVTIFCTCILYYHMA